MSTSGLIPNNRTPDVEPHTALDCLVWCKLGWITKKLHPLIVDKLATKPGMTARQIRSAVNTSYATSYVYRLTNDLLAAGLVFSHPLGQPARTANGGSAQYGYSLTEAGKQLVTQAEGARKR